MITSVLALLVLLTIGTSSLPHDFLSEESVVLVCGAASFLGIEVALGLHRTYSPRKLILVDELADVEDVEGMARLEFQRQRLFRVLQEMSTANTGKGKVVFYRLDLRPEVPAFIDSSAIPLLQYVLKEHNDITHIVYLPEQKRLVDEKIEKDGKVEVNPRALLMHSLLDQLHRWENTTSRPQFTFASSYMVYAGDAANAAGPYEGREDRTITEAPPTIEASAHLLDEILAQNYGVSYGVGSVGLRMSTVYGPYNTPLALSSQIADLAIAAIDDSSRYLALPNQVARHDYVYIDDAVDAVMIAMQVRPPPGPLMINIGSGRSAGVLDLVELAKSYVPKAKFRFAKPAPNQAKEADVVVNIERAKALLGWEPTVPFVDGMLRTFGWHFDRLYPKGKAASPKEPADPSWRNISAAGKLSCDRNDAECLRGTPVFPCASECAHREKCHPSFWDEAARDSRRLSFNCPEVWYTVALSPDLTVLPSVKFRVSSRSHSHLPKCSFAFVSDRSPLVQQLRKESHKSSDTIYHDFWTLIPVKISTFAESPIATLALVPKLTPNNFFTGVKLAVYTDPNVIVDDLAGLISQTSVEPFHPEVPGLTSLLVGKKEQGQKIVHGSTDKSRAQQAATYRMIHIKAMEYINKTRDGFAYEIDSSFLVHRFGDHDSHTFRCDVFSEVWMWQASSDHDALAFVAGLHDTWSQIGLKKSELDPWWYGDKVESVSDAGIDHRRLQETDDVRPAPLQYHHLLQNHLVQDEDDYEEVHRFDENGLVVAKETRRQITPPENAAPVKDETHSTKSEASQDDEEVAESPNKSQSWLSMLSNGKTRFFVRLVSAEDAGVVDLNKHNLVPSLL